MALWIGEGAVTYDGKLKKSMPFHYGRGLWEVSFFHIFCEVFSRDAIILVDADVKLVDGGRFSHDCGPCKCSLRFFWSDNLRFDIDYEESPTSLH